MIRILFIFILFTNGSLVSGQFLLNNASFEDEPQDATSPAGWGPCKQGSTPDIMPGPWGVYTESSEGETYIGLITRDDGSWESIGQRLATTIAKGDCYSFSMDLAHSNTYSGYNLPIRLKIWGGRTRCSKDQLLGEADAVDNIDWQTYEFQFTAKQKINYIILEAYYMKGLMIPYKGNILIDNCTEFKRCIRAYYLDSIQNTDYIKG